MTVTAPEEAAAVSGNVVDTEKDGDAEEVVTTDEEPHESVSEPPKDDSEDVSTATTASARQASAAGINLAEVTLVCANHVLVCVELYYFVDCLL